MTIDELIEMWRTDGPVDRANPDKEAANTPKLHNKYYKMYAYEGLRLLKLQEDLKVLNKLRTEYYRGDLSKEELDENGWIPVGKTVIKQELPLYLNSDPELVKMNLKIGMQRTLVEYLESILRQISNRGYQIKSVIDWERFKAGG